MRLKKSFVAGTRVGAASKSGHAKQRRAQSAGARAHLTDQDEMQPQGFMRLAASVPHSLRNIPDPHRAVAAARTEQAAVVVERDRMNNGPMA